MNLPDPFVAADVDLHGFSGFMLDVDRLLASELVALGTPEECWAAVMLWSRAWKQSPPASLPDDDRVLAAFSGAGRRWSKVKAMALRGFVKCSDGRLYHRVLAEEANEAWKLARKARRKRRGLSQRLRRLVRDRDGRRCRYCGTWQGPFEIDHVFPVSLGGTNALENLAYACRACNQAKRGKPLHEWKGALQ